MSEKIFYEDPSCFSFFTSPKNFQADSRWGIPWALKYLTAPTMLAYESSTEHIISGNLVDKIKGRKCLVVGAGPTATEREWKKTDYDVLLTCNHFYRSPLFQDGTKVDVAIIGPEQDLCSEEILTYFENNATMCVIEGGTSPFHSREEIQDFSFRFPGKIGYYHLRFFDQTGTGPRMVTMAAFAGASEVAFVGVDGHPKLGQHSFQGVDKKHAGTAALLGTEERYAQQFEIWRGYLQGQFPNTVIRNLGFGHPSNQVPFEILGAS